MLIFSLTNQNNRISDDQSVRHCETEFSTHIDHITENGSTEDNNEEGSDVVYTQVYMLRKKTKAISVLPEAIYAQVKI